MWESNRRIAPARGHHTWLLHGLTWLAPGLIVLTCLAAGFFWYVRDHPYFHIAAVRVYGTAHVSRQELIQLARLQRGMSLLRINVEAVRQRLLQHPWIREALVRRRFPNELEIIIYERKPRVLLETGADYVLDSAGQVLAEVHPHDWPGLPRLMVRLTQALAPGEPVHDPGVIAGLRLIMDIQQRPFLRDMELTQVERVPPERFVIQNQWGKLVVGADIGALEEKLALLPAIDETLRARAQQANAIDFSIANQIIVQTSGRTTPAASRLQRRNMRRGQIQ